MLSFLKKLIGTRSVVPTGFLPTGLRIIDLLTPVIAGTDSLITGDQGSASLVLGNEILVRLQTPEIRTLIYFEQSLDDLEARCTELRSYLPQAPGYVTESVTAKELAEHLAGIPRSGHVLIGASGHSERFLQSFRLAIESYREANGQSPCITSLAMATRHHPSGFHSVVHCSALVAKEGIYPAVFPRLSNANESFRPDAPTSEIITRVRNAIDQTIENLYPGALTDGNWFMNQSEKHRSLVQSFAFMSQPYYVAEPYTGMKAERVSLKDAAAQFDKILSGSFLSLAPTAFRYKNSLPIQS